MNKCETREKIISIGIGLQAVDGLTVSASCLKEITRFINGDITIDELENNVESLCENDSDFSKRTKEANQVSIRIAKLLSDDSFEPTLSQLLYIHQYLFNGIVEHPGQYRMNNFTKSEWVLNGESVFYGDYRSLEIALEYEFNYEQMFSYKTLGVDQVITHLCNFISLIWLIHPFEEGNTRTIAVFLIKYLKYLGFSLNPKPFIEKSLFFRNALVRANYINIPKDIYENNEGIVKFFNNLILNTKYVLKNRDLRVKISKR